MKQLALAIAVLVTLGAARVAFAHEPLPVETVGFQVPELPNYTPELMLIFPEGTPDEQILAEYEQRLQARAGSDFLITIVNTIGIAPYGKFCTCTAPTMPPKPKITMAILINPNLRATFSDNSSVE